MAKTSKKGSKNLIVLLAILALSLVLLTAQYYQKNFGYSQTDNSTPSATQSYPSPSPTKKPVLIPKDYGKSVNVPIFYYHYIGQNPNPSDKTRDGLSVAPDKFDIQMTYLSRNGYIPISLDTLYAGLKGIAALPPKPIILSFDDGYIDFYVNAFPILRKFNFHAVAFIPTGLMGQGYYMNWAQIKEIDATGLVSFQAHSVTHANLVTLSDAELKYEVEQSKKDLEKNLGKPVNFFAYPYGSSDERIWQAVRSAGFKGAAGTWAGKTESEGTIFDMPRIKIGGGKPIQEVL